MTPALFTTKLIIATFHQKLELIEYNTFLVLTGAIRGTSKYKFYKKLGQDSFQQRHGKKIILFLTE